jgi:hypothetical protein
MVLTTRGIKMNIAELIQELQQFDPELEVAILDGLNGAGVPRTINLGPVLFDGEAKYEGDENAEYKDIDTEPGNPIVIMGYGFY